MGTGEIRRITAAGVLTTFAAGITGDALSTGITAGPDGNPWFTEPGTDHIGRMSHKRVAPPTE